MWNFKFVPSRALACNLLPLVLVGALLTPTCGQTDVAAGRPGSEAGPPSLTPRELQFISNLRPWLEKSQQAAMNYADGENGLLGDQEKLRSRDECNTASNQFQIEVDRNWPFDLKEVQTPEALAALEKVKEFRRTDYDIGRVSRDAVVEEYLQVAARYPNTSVRDLAMHSAAHLYLQGFAGKDTVDYGKAARILGQLADGTHVSGYALWAEEELAGHIDNPELRMEARSKFYLSAQERSKIDWLSKKLLTPTREETPRAFVKRIEGFLVQIRTVQHTSGANMVSDAMLTKDPLSSLNRLKRQHEGDKFMEGLVAKATESVMRNRSKGDASQH